MQARQLTGGGDASNRRALDFYPTPPEVTTALMDFLKLPTMTIWEPACGIGSMSNVIKSYGHDVIETDISLGDDFFETDILAEAIIINPPFNLSERFIRKSIQDAPIVAMLLKSQYWHAKCRISLFNEFPPAYILPLTWRPDFLFDTRSESNKKPSPTMECLWTVWIKDNQDCKYQPLAKPLCYTTIK